jgi:hypothetical protein
VYGTLARPAPRSDFGPTVNQKLTNPTLTQASRELVKAREDRNYESPCQTQPSLWDGLGDEERREKALGRIYAATALCGICEVFAECEKVKESIITHPDGVTSGTYAGDWVPASPEEFDIRHYLENDEWPQED